MEKFTKTYCLTKLTWLLLAFVCLGSLSGQSWLQRHLPHRVAGLQYAGSTGFVTAGYFRASENDKVQAGIQYGWTPAALGGPLHSLSLKFIHDPFRLRMGESLVFQPLQSGIFVSQNFGRHLGLLWPERYPFMYYWWPRATRTHVFLGSSLSLKGRGWLHHSNYYFEANTNDLYLSSYFNKKNFRSLSPFEIFYLGAGLRLYWK